MITMTEKELEQVHLDAYRRGYENGYAAGYEYGVEVGKIDGMTVQLEKIVAEMEIPANSRFGGTLPEDRRKITFH
jgi:flagellar biosynthesis/type III secretory pathway protein FliH